MSRLLRSARAGTQRTGSTTPSRTDTNETRSLLNAADNDAAHGFNESFAQQMSNGTRRDCSGEVSPALRTGEVDVGDHVLSGQLEDHRGVWVRQAVVQ